MAAPDEVTQLGGLARSIDALFSRRPRAGGDASAGQVQGLEAVEPDPVPPDAEDAPEVSAVPEAAPPPLPVVEDEDPLGSEHLPVDESSAPAPAPATESAPAPAPEHPDGIREEEGVADVSDAGELAAAVDAFLEGEPGTAERVAEAAAPLLADYALDPLADAAERLVQAAGDPPDEAMMAVARSVMNPAVASKLVHRMGAEPEPRRGEYVVLAQRLGRVMAVALRGALTDATDRSARRAYYDALIAMGRTSRPIIEAMIDDENRFLVRNAVAILGEVGGDGAVELVTSALANTDPRVRREALRSLAKLGARDAEQLVLAHLEDSDASVRTAAALAAGELKVERALRHIVAMLEAEDDEERRIELLRALGQLGDPGAVPAVEKHAVGTLFSKPPSEVRVAAYRALHHIGSPHARQVLEQATNDKDLVVRAAARELLGL